MSRITEPTAKTPSAAASQRPVVILGATGMLGQALMRVAAARGLRPIGLSRRTRPSLDLVQVPDLAPVLDPLAPALVINAAACTDLFACEADPLAATELHAHLPGQLAAWARSRRCPWVQVSTDHYWCGEINRLHHEDEPVAPANAYALSKRAGEVMALTDPGALVVRTNVVGLRGWAGRPTFAEWAFAALEAGEPFDAYTDVWASSIEAHQFAQALFDLAQRGATGLVNLASRESVSKAQFIAALAQAAGLGPQAARPVRRPEQDSLRRANAMGLDVARAETWLGRKLPGLTEVVAALVAERAAAAARSAGRPADPAADDAGAGPSVPNRCLDTTFLLNDLGADIAAAKSATALPNRHVAA